MRLIRFGERGSECPGVLRPDDTRIDVSAFGEDWDEGFFAGDGLVRLEDWLAEHAARCPVVEESVRLGPCIARPSKIVCIGLNYAGHVRETGAAMPAEAVIFFKSTTALCGPNDDVVIPRGSQKTDWEVELAVVIGRRATYVPEDRAMDHVAGYALHNDYSERDWQLERGGQWAKGKSFDTFAPIGPFLATPDEIPDPHRLRLWLTVNGEPLQESSTSDLIFGIPALVSYLSQFMTLLPGDVISTGTPAGVGLGLQPPRYLEPGDVVELGIEGLGTARQRAVTYASVETSER
ncbi:MAG: fumarylacetoacetate hydrolase family protein [Gemmatimonadales bacterium]|jgi:2-keto-4-pentenoate hydratase/2-oxohepta-3-ene-1,7-dioic acid hydratase in catechol pathway